MVSINKEVKILLISLIIIAISLSLLICVNSVSDKDRIECNQQMSILSGCLVYLQGNSKAPTSDCCSGLKQALKTNKKCVCVVLQTDASRNNPDLVFKINITLALGLPSVCNAPANYSQCPEILHLAPNSAEAQVFYNSGNNSSNGTISPASSPTPLVAPAVTNDITPGTSAQQKNGGSKIGKRLFGLEAIVVVASIWCFTSNLSI